MSTREWKPGDVALVDLGAGEETVAVVRNHKDDGGAPVFLFATHGFYKTIAVGNTALIRSARPLVVIDPESTTDCNRVALAYESMRDMQAALRSLLAPPRPDEPTGLGAVVEGDGGQAWVRYKSAGHQPWRADEHGQTRFAFYADVNAVRVLSEGVTQ